VIEPSTVAFIVTSVRLELFSRVTKAILPARVTDSMFEFPEIEIGAPSLSLLSSGSATPVTFNVSRSVAPLILDKSV